jgi:hypothetical protein
MAKVVIAVVLLAHGIGHSLGPLQMFDVATTNPAWRGESWILTGPLGTTLTQLVGITLWIAAIVGFSIAAAIVIGWLPASWFGPVAIVSSVVSLMGIALFPIAFPTTSTVGALVVDVGLLLALWLHLLPSEITA